MRVPQVLGEALQALSTNRLRTSLTMLGVIIGVCAVVVMLAVGRGTQSLVNQSIATMGSNLLVVFPGSQTSGGVRFGAGAAQTLTVGDATAIESVPNVVRVAPVVMRSFQLAYGNTNWSAMVTGSTPDYFPLRAWDVEDGELFSEADVRSNARVAVIGQTTARQLFGDESPLGKTIRIRNLPFTVIGVLARKGQALAGRVDGVDGGGGIGTVGQPFNDHSGQGRRCVHKHPHTGHWGRVCHAQCQRAAAPDRDARDEGDGHVGDVPDLQAADGHCQPRGHCEEKGAKSASSGMTSSY